MSLGIAGSVRLLWLTLDADTEVSQLEQVWLAERTLRLKASCNNTRTTAGNKFDHGVDGGDGRGDAVVLE
jgi:hypothetical protein